MLPSLNHEYPLTDNLVYQIDVHIGICILFVIIKFIDGHHSAVAKLYLI